jgi:hypothetical protein
LEARQVKMEVTALHLEAVAICQEAQATHIREEAHMVAHLMTCQEEAVCQEEVGGIQSQNSCCRKDYCFHL